MCSYANWFFKKMPSTHEEWTALPHEVEEKWQLPNSLAAAASKHICIHHPDHSGSEFYNYKGFYSIVLMMFMDFDDKFVWKINK